MTEYKIVFEKLAEKFIMKQPKPERERILRAVYKLPNEGDRKKLKGNKGLLRLRVGDYRIIYTVDEGKLVVLVVDADNRGQIYRRY